MKILVTDVSGPPDGRSSDRTPSQNYEVKQKSDIELQGVISKVIILLLRVKSDITFFE